MSNLQIEHEPKHQNEAVKSKKWVSAMNEEIEALKKNNTWKIVDVPKRKHVIGWKWLYRVKYQ